eukprot:jgi/Mesen1/9814/ME000007S09872
MTSSSCRCSAAGESPSYALYISGLQSFVSAVGAMFLTPWLGGLSDRHGRKPFLLLCFALNVAPFGEPARPPARRPPAELIQRQRQREPSLPPCCLFQLCLHLRKALPLFCTPLTHSTRAAPACPARPALPCPALPAGPPCSVLSASLSACLPICLPDVQAVLPA